VENIKQKQIKNKKTDMLRSVSKQPGNPRSQSSPEEERRGYGAKALQERKGFKPGMKD